MASPAMLRMALIIIVTLQAGCADCGRALEIENADLTTGDAPPMHARDAAAFDAAAFDAAAFDAAAFDAAAFDQASTARAWQPAVNLVPSGLGPSYAPAVAINSHGAAIVGWRFNGATQGQAAVSRFSFATQAWSTADTVPLTAEGFAPIAVGLDEDEQAGAYQCTDDGELANYDPTLASWSVQTLAAPQNGINCGYPIALPRSTRIVALWQQSVMQHEQLWTGRYENLAWTQIQQLEMGSLFVIESLAIGAHATGTAAALWVSNLSTTALRASLFDPLSATWSSAVRVDDGSSTPSNVAIAVDGAGDAIAVWDDSSLGHLGTIWSSHFSASTQSWDHQQGIFTGGAGPTVALSGDGTAIAIWQTTTPGAQAGPNDRLWWSRYRGGTWAVPTALLLGPASDVDPHVAMNDAGEAVAAWSVGTDIWASRFE
jgi:hypothetical protein